MISKHADALAPSVPSDDEVTAAAEKLRSRWLSAGSTARLSGGQVHQRMSGGRVHVVAVETKRSGRQPRPVAR